jgi:hypothetical protein
MKGKTVEKNKIIEINLGFKLLLGCINSLINYNKLSKPKKYNENKVTLNEEIINQIKKMNKLLNSSESSEDGVYESWKRVVQLAINASKSTENFAVIYSAEPHSEPCYCFKDECLFYLQEIIKSQIIEIN